MNEDVEQLKQITGTEPVHKIGDLLESDVAKQLVSETIATYGRIDVLVNNAGHCCVGDNFLNPDLMSENYDKIMNLNVRLVMKMIHLCVPHLRVVKVPVQYEQHLVVLLILQICLWIKGKIHWLII